MGDGEPAMNIPSKAVGAEDIRKIHAEINQIVNQRFLLMTAAITIFGVVISQMIPKDIERIRDVVDLMRIEEIFFLIVLLVLFRLSLLLRLSLQVFAAYLVVKGASEWEADWRKFRSTGYRPYTHAYTDLFMLLGFLTMMLPVIIQAMFGTLGKGRAGLCIDLAAGILYLILVWGAGRKDWFQGARDPAERWKEVL